MRRAFAHSFLMKRPADSVFRAVLLLQTGQKQRIITMAAKQVLSVAKVDKFSRLGFRTPI